MLIRLSHIAVPLCVFADSCKESYTLPVIQELYGAILIPLSFAATFGALPIQTKSLLFLIPARTTNTSLVSTPTQWPNSYVPFLNTSYFASIFGLIMLRNAYIILKAA